MYLYIHIIYAPWTIACQPPLSMEFSRQEYWSGLPFPSPGDLPDPGIESGSPALQEDSLLPASPEKPLYIYIIHTHTHTHTHIYIYIYISACTSFFSFC